MRIGFPPADCRLEGGGGGIPGGLCLRILPTARVGLAVSIFLMRRRGSRGEGAARAGTVSCPSLRIPGRIDGLVTWSRLFFDEMRKQW